MLFAYQESKRKKNIQANVFSSMNKQGRAHLVLFAYQVSKRKKYQDKCFSSMNKQ